MGALAASWKKQKPEQAAGGNLEDVFCKLSVWMGGEGRDPPSTGKRGDDPTKEAPNPHTVVDEEGPGPCGVEFRIARFSIRMQEAFFLLLLCLGSVGLLVVKNLPEEKLKSQTLNVRHSQCFHGSII